MQVRPGALPTFSYVGTMTHLLPFELLWVLAGYIHVYRLLDGGKRFSLVHKTQVEGVPTAVCGFQGRLLVGIGKMLRIYDLGKRKLLRKCENKGFPHCIQSITTQVPSLPL